MSILHVNQISGALHRMFDGLIDLADASGQPDALHSMGISSKPAAAGTPAMLELPAGRHSLTVAPAASPVYPQNTAH